MGDLDAALGADARRDARRQGDGLRHAGRARRRARRARSLRGRARGGRAGARAAAARRSSRRCTTAPRRTRPPTIRAPTSTSRASRRNAQRECVGRFEAFLRRLGVLDDDARRAAARATPRRRCARGSPPPRPSRRAGPALALRARVRRPAARDRRAREVRVAELTLVEAVNDALHTELARDDIGAGARRGRRSRGRRLPCRRSGLHDRFGPDRCVDTPLAEAGLLGAAVGLCMAGCARVRDAVRRVLVSLPRPADHACRPLPLADARRDRLSDHDPHALRRRRPRARAARRLARGLLRAHARDQGRDPVDAGRREGPARRRDPRPRPGRRLRAEARLPDRARRGARGRACRSARQGADRARRRRGDAASRTARWSPSASARRTAAGHLVRGRRHPLAAPARRARRSSPRSRRPAAS